MGEVTPIQLEAPPSAIPSPDSLLKFCHLVEAGFKQGEFAQKTDMSADTSGLGRAQKQTGVGGSGS